MRHLEMGKDHYTAARKAPTRSASPSSPRRSPSSRCSSPSRSWAASSARSSSSSASRSRSRCSCRCSCRSRSTRCSRASGPIPKSSTARRPTRRTAPAHAARACDPDSARCLRVQRLVRARRRPLSGLLSWALAPSRASSSASPPSSIVVRVHHHPAARLHLDAGRERRRVLRRLPHATRLDARLHARARVARSATSSRSSRTSSSRTCRSAAVSAARRTRATIYVRLQPHSERDRTLTEIQNDLRGKLRQIPASSARSSAAEHLRRPRPADPGQHAGPGGVAPQDRRGACSRR